MKKSRNLSICLLALAAIVAPGLAGCGLPSLPGPSASPSPLASPAPAPGSEPGTLSRIERHGISWTLAQARPCGVFANGDPWVLGPVEIVAIDPAPAVLADGRVVNGSMVNPAIAKSQGYDSMMMGIAASAYDPALNAAWPAGAALSPANPLRLGGGSSLLSSESVLDPAAGSLCWTKRVAVLTVLEARPPQDAFRPCYAGGDKAISHRLAELDLSRLPELLPPSGVAIPSLEATAAKMELPWIEHFPGWQKQNMSPRDNMPNYGRELAAIVSDAALTLCLAGDPAQKRLLALRLVQIGLDNAALCALPGGASNWSADGGHMTGRAFPIVFASWALGDPGIAAVLQKSGDYAYSGGHHEGALPADYIHFGEIDQTFYVSQRDIDRMAGGVVAGVWSPDERRAAIAYAQSDLGRADWGIRHSSEPSRDTANPAAQYRGVVTPVCSGFVLASRILGLKERWNHNALFDYLDRWMSSDPFFDSPFASDPLVSQSSNGLGAFMTAMWARYRADY